MGTPLLPPLKLLTSAINFSVETAQDLNPDAGSYPLIEVGEPKAIQEW